MENSPDDSAVGVSGEIRSAGTSECASPSLAKFHALLLQTQNERRTLLPELKRATDEARRLDRKRAAWENGWLLRRLFPSRLSRIQALDEEANARREELEEQEKLSRLHTQIDVSDGVRRSYSQLVHAFAVLTTCERKWDAVRRVATDRVRQRTTAATLVDRVPVSFDFSSCDLIESEWKVPHLCNANGGDLYFYPGFILFFVSADRFACVDALEVEIGATPATYQEEETIPSDSRLIGRTWKKSNKDGSPDRRFANNYEVQIVEYGSLEIRSPNGLNEEYLISSFTPVAKFAVLWNMFKQSIMEESERSNSVNKDADSAADADPLAE